MKQYVLSKCSDMPGRERGGAAVAFRPGDMLHCSHAFSLLAFLTPFFSCLGTSNGVVYLEVVSRMSSSKP